METKKIIILVLFLLLILSGGIVTFMGGTRVLGMGRMLGQAGQFSGTPLDGSMPPQGGQLSPPKGMGAPPSGFDMGQPGDAANRPQGQMRGGQDNTQLKLIRLGHYALGGGIILLGLLALMGVWLNKKWGRALTVIIAAIVLVATLTTLVQMRFTLSMVIELVKILISIIVIILSFLPVKKTLMETENA